MIDVTPGCSYLYGHFDKMVRCLERWERTTPNDDDIDDLTETIKKYAYECMYCTYGTSAWHRYAANSLYCADFLMKFIHVASVMEVLERLLSTEFDRLKDTNAIIFVNDILVRKYLLRESGITDLQSTYRRMIERAVGIASRHSPKEADVEYEAYQASRFAYRWITEYIDMFGDRSLLKKWIPALKTERLVDIWCNFPDRYIREQALYWQYRNRNDKYLGRRQIDRIKKYLDDSLQQHLCLWCIWFESDVEEASKVLEANGLMEIVNITDDGLSIRGVPVLLDEASRSKLLKIICENGFF